jgi:hypothetical protein
VQEVGTNAAPAFLIADNPNEVEAPAANDVAQVGPFTAKPSGDGTSTPFHSELTELPQVN